MKSKLSKQAWCVTLPGQTTHLACMKPWVKPIVLKDLGVIVHTCNPSTQDVKTGGSEVQVYPWLYNSKFWSSLRYMKPVF